jgi:trehalose 6-phosphate phosphatase
MAIRVGSGQPGIMIARRTEPSGCGTRSDERSDAGSWPLLPLRPQEMGLFLDVDGTLLDLAPHPDAVEVPPGLVGVLAAVERRLDGALALVSGRPIAALDRLFAPLRLLASGVHGAEIRCPSEGESRMPAERQIPAVVWSELVLLLERFPGSFAENKRASFAVHYRGIRRTAGELGAALAELVARFPAIELELTAGHLVFEIRLPGFDKGKAIERFMAKAPFLDRRPVFIADDAMDRAGFDATLARGGLAYSVGRELPGLSGCFPEAAAVRAWLGRLGQ